jgi:hypothetical protein
MSRMVQPGDVKAAVTWYCGVDPDAPKNTRRVQHAKRVLYATLRYRLGMGVSEIATWAGRATGAVTKTMALEDIDIATLDAVMARATIEMHLDCEAELDRDCRLERAHLAAMEGV